jgi:alcohol dehydrogenase
VQLLLEMLWTRDVTITTGLVDTYSIPVLSRLVASRRLDVARFATHHFRLEQFVDAYELFANASETGALKVVLRPSYE